MSDQKGRGKSRGRGGRGKDEKKQQFQAPGQYGPPQPPVPIGVWGRRPDPSESQAGPSQMPYSRPLAPQQAPQSAGRVFSRLGPRGDTVPGPREESTSEPMEVVTESGDTGGGIAGRGAMRGRRVIGPEIQTRPSHVVSKRGTTGKNVMLQANFFKLLTTTDWCLYQYRVDFAPEEDRTAIRKGLLKVHKQTLGAYVFDGTVMYSSRHIQEQLELWSARQSDEAKIRITVRLVGDMKKGDQHYLQFFNIIMRKCLDLLDLQLVGRDYFDAHSRVEVRDFRLELWPGYLTSIRQHENNILMCAEITHKVMRQQTLFDILRDCYQQNENEYQQLFESQIVGLVVLTDYNNHTYRITDIDFKTNPNSTFQLRGGERISYKDYYKNKYQINIRSDSQPMLVTRLKPKERRAGQTDLVYLVPELCRATGLTDNMRDNFNLMRALSQHTRVSPSVRIDKLMTFNRRLRSERGIVQELNEWNLKLDDRLIEIPGRILPPEKIVLGGNRTVSAGQFADWTRELQQKVAFNPARLSNWSLIYISRMRRDVESFVGILQQVGNGMGCRIDHPRLWDINDDRSNTYSDVIERIMSTSNPELIYCVVSNNRADRYGAIKKKCIVDRPVPSQVMLARNLTAKSLWSIATKIAIQLNCKLGGSPWSVELPPINLMVVGFDVCHDPTDKSRDYSAVVASLDKGLTRYFSAVSHHRSGEELSNEFASNVSKAIQNYRKLNKVLPSHIVIYRDGVGEGQVQHVLDHEVGQLNIELEHLYGTTTPIKMAFVIVTKRINTRFFHNQNNPSAGTIVDDVVTNPLRYDFFIIPQSVRQGTVTPCAYNVIADTTGWKPDQMQRMTYKLCHMYYNFSGTVRVPAPCQYAHKLAFLVAQFIRRKPDPQMDTLLYFL